MASTILRPAAKLAEKNRQRQHDHVQRLRAEYNNVAPLPDVADPERRESTKYSFKLWNEIYFANKFPLRWSRTHLELIDIMEQSVLEGGGSLAFACPRGFGKTSLSESLAEWALLHGHKKFVVLIGATGIHGKELHASILTDIETNDLLEQDFPEVVHPIKMLEGQFLKSKFQHYNNEPTRIIYGRDKLVFPTIPNSVASGSVVQCCSITGRLRGIKHTTANGVSIRPDLVLIDDPQTDRSARSFRATDVRERVIMGAVMGLSGPSAEVTALMPCTVIRKGDLAERFLDQERKPEWQGRRTKLLSNFPKNMDLWMKYAEIRANSFRNGGKGVEAIQFYRDNRVAMDDGAVVSWEERYNPKRQLSAIQAAMDLYFSDPTAFASEYQNEPLIELNTGVAANLKLEKDKLVMRTSGLPFGVVPRSTMFLTTGVDIQDKILFYTTVAWTDDFGGVICDYGTCPKQSTLLGWNAGDPPVSLHSMSKHTTVGPRIYDGLIELNKTVFNRTFKYDETNDAVSIGRIGIDANWALSSDAVYSFAKEFGQSNDRIIACHGRGIPATMVPMSQWAKKVGEIKGDDWRILPATIQANKGRHLSFDGNTWKSTVAERLLIHKAEKNALLFYGSNSYTHDVFAQHCASEDPVQTEGRGGRIIEWKNNEGSSIENHFWDCLILSAVAAASLGLKRHVRIIEVADGQAITAPRPQRQRKSVDVPTNRR